MESIVILGAGSFGGSIAEHLAPDHNVTVVDQDDGKLDDLRARVDARFIAGAAESPSILAKAGCEEADAILAVTSNDIVNLSACYICSTVFDVSATSIRIARIRNRELSSNKELVEAFGVTDAYNTEDLISEAIKGVVEFGARKVLRYWGDRANIVLVPVRRSDDFVGLSLQEWYAANPTSSFRVAAVHRGRTKRVVPADNDTKIKDGDELVIITKDKDVMEAINPSRSKEQIDSSKVFIGGGGTIGEAIAAKLERDYNVTLIEPDQARCAALVRSLDTTVVNTGDPTDVSVLRSEDIENANFYCAVTENDEINIMSALLAKQQGCDKVVVLINRNAYQTVLEQHSMDSVISPSETTVGTLLTALSNRSYNRIQPVDEAGGHMLEFTVQPESRLSGQAFNAIQWPPNAIPIAVGVPLEADAPDGARKLMFSDSNATLKGGENVIVYVIDKNNATLNELVDIPFFV